MGFCVSGRQPYSVLNKVEEIKLFEKDADKLYDFIEKIPHHSFVLCNWSGKLDVNFYKVCAEKLDKFCICLNFLSNYKELQDNGINWYWEYPITNFVELSKLVALKPCYLQIGAPLSFNLDAVTRIAGGIPLRLVVNEFGPDYFPTIETIRTQWIRPEDIQRYGEKVAIFEFSTNGYENDPLKREQILLKIYEKESWPGNLNLLLPELGVNVDNRAILDNFGEIRMNCGQDCYSKRSCHYCENAILFATRIKKEQNKNG